MPSLPGSTSSSLLSTTVLEEKLEVCVEIERLRITVEKKKSYLVRVSMTLAVYHTAEKKISHQQV